MNTKILNEYTIEEHLHRFGVWTAARAASKRRLKNTEVEVLNHKIRFAKRGVCFEQ